MFYSCRTRYSRHEALPSLLEEFCQLSQILYLLSSDTVNPITYPFTCQGNATSFKQSKRQSLKTHHRVLVIVVWSSSYPKLISRSKSNTDKPSTWIKAIRTHVCKLQIISQNPDNQSVCHISAINDHSVVMKNHLAYTRIK